MSEVTIVALPEQDDRVNRLSSEKVAHLTLAYLGEVSSADDLLQVIEFVSHAASQMSPFHMTVEYRDTLGPKDADVLFFDKSSWSLDRVSAFRHNLLLNDVIRRAYDGVKQFPEWTPHLTVGYPDSPAHELDDDRKIYGVHFDRIAVWVDDYAGPEFRLKYDDYGTSEAAWSSMSGGVSRGLAAIGELFHYGKKGMKWGVRNDKGHEGERVKTKKLDKLDKKWEADMNRTAYIKLHNAAADKMNNGGIDALNNSPKWKDVDFRKKENEGKLDEYYADHEAAFQKAMVDAGPSLGMNPSGTKQFVIKKVKDEESGEEYDDVFLEPVGKDLKHAEGDTEIAYRLVRGADGKVTKYEQVELELAHFGTKGMKWGVRKSDGERGRIKRGATKAATALNAGAKVVDEGNKKLIFLPQEKRNSAAIKTQTRVLGEAASVNRSAQFKGKDLKKDPELQKAYAKEVTKRAKKVYAEELGIARTEAWGDFLGVDMSNVTAQMRFDAAVDRMQHSSDATETLLVLDLEFDELGQIKGTSVAKSTVSHGDLEYELFHYGVKGMRWGHRNGEKTGRSKGEPKEVVVEQKKAGTYAKASGGTKQPLHPDAVPALAARQKAKGSTTDSLSNDELRKANERLQLEASFNKLTASNDRRSAGARFAAGFFGIKKPDPKVDQLELEGEKLRKAVAAALAERDREEAA